MIRDEKNPDLGYILDPQHCKICTVLLKMRLHPLSFCLPIFRELFIYTQQNLPLFKDRKDKSSKKRSLKSDPHCAKRFIDPDRIESNRRLGDWLRLIYIPGNAYTWEDGLDSKGVHIPGRTAKTLKKFIYLGGWLFLCRKGGGCL